MKTKYYLLEGFGFYRDGEAWIKINHESPVVVGGIETLRVSLVVHITGKYYTHSYENRFGPYDTWHKSLSGVYDNLQLCTGAYGTLNHSRKPEYMNACVACCEASQRANGHISYVFEKPRD